MNNYYKEDIDKYQDEENAFKQKYGNNLASAKYTDVAKYNQSLANKNYAMSAYDQYNKIQSQDLNAKTQLSIAQEQAKKYSQGMLNYQGLGSQGIAETTNASFRNAYMNSIGQQNVATNKEQIALQQQYAQNKIGQENAYNQDVNKYQYEQSNNLANQFNQYRQSILSLTTVDDVKNYVSAIEQYSGLTPEQIKQFINSDVDLAYHLKQLGYDYTE